MSSNTWAQLPIRLIIGSALMYHGFPKLFSEEGQKSFIKILEGMGVPLPRLMVWVVGILEFGGGLALFVGIRVRIMAIVVVIELAINMVGGIIRGGFPEPLPGQQPLPGYENSLLYIAGLLALIQSGGGDYSIDKLIDSR